MTDDEMRQHWRQHFIDNPPPPPTDEQIVVLRAAFNVDAPVVRERSAA